MKSDPIGSRGALLLLSLLASSSVLATARAADVTFPKDHPKVRMQVPDDWAVTYSDFGMEIISPEKNLVIVAGLVPHKKSEANAWAIKAEKRLEAFGVTFDTAPKAAPAPVSPPEAKSAALAKPADTAPPAKPAPSPPSQVATAVTTAKTEVAVPTGSPPAPPSMSVSSIPKVPASMPSAATPPVATPPAAAIATDVRPTEAKNAPNIPVDRTAPTFTFMNPPTKIEPPEEPPAPPAAAYFGPPSLDTPTRPKAPTAVKVDEHSGSTLEELTRPPVIKPKIPFGEGHLPSATFDGKPIDVEIVNFSVSPTQLFIVLQASGPTDNRAVAIMQSVKPAT